TISFLDTFIQLPIITPYAKELVASNVLAGGIVAIYSLTNMIGNIIGGHWIDRFGRKCMLIFGMSAVAVIILFYTLSATVGQLCVLRLEHRLACGVLSTAAFAYVGDQTSEQNRGKAMALTGACIGIAAIFGPTISGILAASS